MKTLKKLKINEFVEMTNSEMKHIVGGSGSDSNAGGSGTDPCPCVGKFTTIKCYITGTDDVDREWNSTGCPDENECAEGQRMSCACS